MKQTTATTTATKNQKTLPFGSPHPPRQKESNLKRKSEKNPESITRDQCREYKEMYMYMR